MVILRQPDIQKHKRNPRVWLRNLSLRTHCAHVFGVRCGREGVTISHLSTRPLRRAVPEPGAYTHSDQLTWVSNSVLRANVTL